MNCKEAQTMITPYIENELSPHETMQFISHVRGCPSCFDELEIYFTIFNALQASEVKGSYDMGKRIRDDMNAREKALRREKWESIYIWAGLALVFLAGVIIVFFVLFPQAALTVFLHLRSIVLKLMGQ